MATFTFDHTIDIHWNGYDIVGPAGTVFSIPDQLYEEFESDIRDVEPSLTWIDTNEFETLRNDVSTSTLSATFPVAVSTSTSGKTISLSSSTNPNGYLMAADGSGGVIFTPASTSGLTSVVGVSPISTAIAGGTVSVSLNASYQTAGTYVTSVIGSSPISTSGTTAITVSVDQASLTVASSSNAETLRTRVKNSSGSTITKGQAVYVTGADGTNALIGLSTASTEAGSSKTLGIAANTMTNNEFGYVIENGQLSNIDTSATTAGASVWLGNTPGSLVFGAPPAEPSHAVYLGVVTKANASTGEILVKVQNGYELDELHDVSAGSPTDLDILQYKSSSSLWTKASIANAGIAASSHTHNYQASGTYVNAVIGTSPASVSTASGTATVSISSGTSAIGSVLTADGSGGVSFLAISGTSISTFTSSGTYTKPASATMFYVYAVGGGGGGAGGARLTVNGGNGGSGTGGQAVWRLFRSVDISTDTVAVTIGAGGVSVAGSSTTVPTPGNNGNTTSFGTNLLVANGGKGATGASKANPADGRIITTGDATNGDGHTTNATFGPGAGGIGSDRSGANGSNGTAGFSTHTPGGSASGGTGGTSGATPTAGGNGLTYGAGGGGGGCSTTASVAGGDGGTGALPGGGGGGGGAQRATSATTNGGAGGAGGSGILIVIAW